MHANQPWISIVATYCKVCERVMPPWPRDRYRYRYVRGKGWERVALL